MQPCDQAGVRDRDGDLCREDVREIAVQLVEVPVWIARVDMQRTEELALARERQREHLRKSLLADERRVAERRGAQVSHDHRARAAKVAQRAVKGDPLRRGVVLGKTALPADDQGVLLGIGDHQRRRVGAIERPRCSSHLRVEAVEIQDPEHLARQVVETSQSVPHRHVRSIGAPARSGEQAG
jgi:hypothetical protein